TDTSATTTRTKNGRGTRKRPRIPSYKLPKSPGHPSLAQQSPPPTPQLLATAQQQEEEEYLPSDASSGS
ncbi:hypothetical protein CHS0354_003474, partial [Potamilus streckersoni]